MRVRPGDIIVAEEEGVVVVPQERAGSLLKALQLPDHAAEARTPVCGSNRARVERGGRT